MLVSKEIDIKCYYRFIEFTSKLIGIQLPHERFKRIAMDDYKAESKQEVKVKQLANAYLYLLNNIQQSFTKELLEHTYILLTNKRLNKNKIQNILTEFYKNYDESGHYLAAYLHLVILEQIKIQSIEFALMISNYILLKKGRFPIVVYSTEHKIYKTTIQRKNLEKLIFIFHQLEHKKLFNFPLIEWDKQEIIEKIKSLKSQLKVKYKIKKFYLYGSYAKEKVTLSSDLDFLVIFNEEVIPTEKSFLLKQLKEDLQTQMNIKIDLLDFSHALKFLDICEMENIVTLI